MAGFASYNDIINALSVNGQGQERFWSKPGITTVAAGIYDYAMQTTGIPGPGYVVGTALTGRAILSTTAGMPAFANPTGPAQEHLLLVGAGSTVSLGVLMLYDRLIEYPFNGTVTSGTFTQPGTFPPRDAAGTVNGAGVLMFVENTNATASTTPTLNITYTNQAGTTGRTTGAIALIGAAQHRLAQNQLWWPLAAGDSGVRSVQSYALSATATSTLLNIVLCRPLAFIPVPSGNTWVERDLVLQVASMPRLFDNTALCMALIANTTTSPMQARVLSAEN